MEKLPRVSPPFNWRLISWLCASPRGLAAEASAELRALLFSRMSSLLLSAAGGLIIEVVAVSRRPNALLHHLARSGRWTAAVATPGTNGSDHTVPYATWRGSIAP